MGPLFRAVRESKPYRLKRRAELGSIPGGRTRHRTSPGHGAKPPAARASPRHSLIDAEIASAFGLAMTERAVASPWREGWWQAKEIGRASCRERV